LHSAFGVLNGCDCEDRYLLRFEAVEYDGHLFRKYNKNGDKHFFTRETSTSNYGPENTSEE